MRNGLVIAITLIAGTSFAEPAPETAPLAKQSRNLMLRSEAIFGVSTKDIGYAFDGVIGLGGFSEVGIHSGNRQIAVLEGIEIIPRRAEFASLKLGVRPGSIRWWSPGLTVAFVRQIKKSDAVATDLDTAALSVSTNWEGDFLKMRAGFVIWHTELESEANERHFAPRPTVGVSYNPPRFPRTWISADLDWGPTIELNQNKSDLDWNLSWGVRYDAFDWASVDLVVRHRGQFQNTLVSLGFVFQL